MRALSLFLVICIFSTSAPAAPLVVSGMVSGFSADASFFFQHRLWDLLAQLTGDRTTAQQEKQQSRDARISRIEISPGDVTLQVGQHMVFAATAFDGKNEPVGGVNIKWKARELGGRKQKKQMSATGEFVSPVAGEFAVTAEGAGARAEVTVRVVDESGGRRSFTGQPQEGEQPSSTKEVSTRDEPEKIAAELKPKSDGQRSSRRERRGGRGEVRFVKASVAPPPEPAAQSPHYVWDDTNYTAADDPGNMRGDPPGSPADGGVGSGNFQMGAPVIDLPGRAINLKLALIYNSQVWSKSGSQVTYDIDQDWPAPGWSLGFGRLIKMGTSGSMLVDADGTRHSYTGTMNNYSWGSVFNGYTTDSTFVDYTHSTNASGVITSAAARYPDGTTVFYGAPGRNAVYPTQITDPNGNYVTITYVGNAGPNIQTVTDTLGRVVNFHYDASDLLTAVTGPGLGGGTRTLVRLHYRWLTLGYSFSGVSAQVQSQTVPVIDAIYYPATRSGFWFGDADSYSSYGMIAKAQEQRSMVFSAASLNEQGSVTSGTMANQRVYNYPMSASAGPQTGPPGYTTQTETWSGMDVPPAVTTYAVQQNTSPRTVSITQPDGSRSVQYSYNAPNAWNDGLIYQDELYDSGNRLWHRSTVTWQQGAYGSVRPVRNENMDELGQVTAEEFSYGSQYNQVTEVRSYGYGGYELLHRTVTEYENSANYTNRHIFSLVKNVTVYDRDGFTRLSRTEFQYDGAGTTLKATPNATMHAASHNPYAPAQWVDEYCHLECPPNTPISLDCPWVCHPGYWQTVYQPSTDYRGNVTRITKYADAANLAGPVVETRGYDVTGNVVKTSSSCCEETTANYTADTQYAYPIALSRGSSNQSSSVRVTTQSTYDFNTGLVRTHTDANGRLSLIEYSADSLRPIFAYITTGAYTVYAYSDDQTTVSEALYHAGGALVSASAKYFDGRGQMNLELVLAPGSVYDVVYTQYDQFGRVWRQSAPYRNFQGVQMTENFYDVLGRPTTAVGPDGSGVETFYNEASRPPGASSEPGQTKRSVDAWGRERWERADASGRVVEVAEPNPSGNGLVSAPGALITRYRYDSLGYLAEVTQGEQQRRFRHDALGRMTHQKLAEAAATLNDAGQYVGAGQWSHVAAYDEQSNLAWQVDARGVRTTYTYNNDPLNRLQSISYSTAGVGDTSSPVEAAPTIRYEYMTTGDLSRLSRVIADGVSTEEFAYDVEGRPWRKTLTMASRPDYPMAIEYAYDTTNRLTDVRYPSQYGAGGATKYVHYDYDVASRLSALKVNGADYGSQATYNAAGRITSLLVGAAGNNQIQETYDYDTKTGLLASQRVVRNGTALLNLTYDYWGTMGIKSGRTGQLKRITNNLDAGKSRAFDYDALGRLAKATNGSTWSERYTYDRYGNRTSVTSAAGIAAAPATQTGASVQLAHHGGQEELPALLRPASARSVSDAAPLSPLSLARPPQAPLPGRDARTNDTAAAAEPTPTESTPTTTTTEPPQSASQSKKAKPQATPQPSPQSQPETSPDVQTQGAVICQSANCGGNLAPRAEPGGPYSGQPNQAIQFDGSQSYDPDGAVILYSWSFGDGTTSTLVNPTKAYAAAGTYNVTLRVRDDVGQWSMYRFTTATIGAPTPVNNATFVSQSVPTAMTAGQSYTVSVTMNNSGTKTWTAADLHRLGSQNPSDNATWGLTRVAVPSTVAPGQNATFTFNVTAPSAVGTYNFQWGMVQDGVGWFGGLTTNVAVAVTQPVTGGCSGPAPCDGHPTISYDPTSNRINSPGWLYDAAGNQIRTRRSDGSWQRLVYDAAGRLVKLKDDAGNTFLTYRYGASTQRLVTQEGGDASNQRTYHVWDGSSVIAEFGESSVAPITPRWQKNYFYMDGRLLATQEPGNGGTESVLFHHPDHLSTRLITSQATGMSVEQTNLPFGNAMNSESTGGTARRFTSYERSAASGLDYALNRHYDPLQGRFTQPDPIGLSATNLSDPQSLNLYAYCGNDPVNGVDPDGLFFGKLFKAIGKIFKSVVKAIGKIANFVGKTLTAIAKVLHSRWVMLGLTILSLVFPPLLPILKLLPKVATILQVTGLLLQGKFKELASLIIQVAIKWAINKVLSFIADKLQQALGMVKRLSECAKDILGAILGEDGQPLFSRALLDSVRIYSVPWIWGAAAWTFGSRQYYHSRHFDETTPAGLALIAHELLHSRDYARRGTLRFVVEYTFNAILYGFDENAKRHPFEGPAYDLQRILKSKLSEGCAGGQRF